MLFQFHFSRIRPSTGNTLSKRFSSFFDFLAYTYIIRPLPNFPRFFSLPQGKERTFRPTRGDLFLTLPPPPPSNLSRTLFVHADTDSKFDTWRNSSLSLFFFLLQTTFEEIGNLFFPRSSRFKDQRCSQSKGEDEFQVRDRLFPFDFSSTIRSYPRSSR